VFPDLPAFLGAADETERVSAGGVAVAVGVLEIGEREFSSLAAMAPHGRILPASKFYRPTVEQQIHSLLLGEIRLHDLAVRPSVKATATGNFDASAHTQHHDITQPDHQGTADHMLPPQSVLQHPESSDLLRFRRERHRGSAAIPLWPPPRRMSCTAVFTSTCTCSINPRVAISMTSSVSFFRRPGYTSDV